MTNQIISVSRPRSTKKRIAAVLFALVGSMGLVFGAAMPANAAGSLSATTITSGNDVTVTGSAPAGAARYAVAVCNITVLPIGSGCTHEAGSYTSVRTGSSFTADITVYRTWDNWTFIPPSGFTGDETVCKNSAGVGDQCAVVISWYDASFTPVGQDVLNVTVN